MRAITRVTGDGAAVRVHLANRYGGTPSPDGTTPLRIAAATVALRDEGAAVVPGTMRVLTFGGEPDVTIAPGGTVVSDAVPLGVAAGDDLAVSLHVEAAAVPPAHAASFVTSFATAPFAGDRTADVDGAAFGERTTSTPIVTAIDVASRSLKGAIVVTGDSKVDGTGSDVDGYNDFPSHLSERLRRELPRGQMKTVVNHGIGGTTAASGICALPLFGPSVDERMAEQSLDAAGLTHLVVFAGTNDLGFGCTAEQIIAAFVSIAQQAHARGVDVLISTVTPRASYTSVQNAHRAVVNDWVREGGDCSGHCDRSLDFDAVVRDPSNPNQLNLDYDSGDGIHPGPEGYRLIAESIPLDALR